MATINSTESSAAMTGDPATDDDAIMKTPDYRVGAAIRDLRSIILLIQDLRMNNETADYILRDHKDIAYCAEWLTNLSDDMRAAIFNSQIVDLRDKISVWHKAAE